MPLYLTEDQTMLRDTARAFMAAEAPVAHYRKYRDMGCKDGFSHALWKQFGEMGFAGVLVSEAEGGLGLGAVEATIVLEEVGRNLTPSPLLVSGVAAAALGGTEQGARWLPGIIAGNTVAALALDEGPRHAPEQVALRAERRGNGFVLAGAKQFVVQGSSADVILVAARTGGRAGEQDGLTLFAVEKGASGLDVEGVRLADASMAARLTLSDVYVDADAVVGEVDGGWERLSRALNAGRVGAAAELLGVGCGAQALTMDYIKQRQQFGRPIGSFQALQHRAAHLHSELEIARAAVLKAAQALDETADDAALWVSVAKAKASRASTLAVQEGVQMHGGVGMTDEYDIGLYMKRDRVLGEFWGGADYHTGEVARLLGY